MKRLNVTRELLILLPLCAIVLSSFIQTDVTSTVHSSVSIVPAAKVSNSARAVQIQRSGMRGAHARGTHTGGGLNFQ